MRSKNVKKSIIVDCLMTILTMLLTFLLRRFFVINIGLETTGLMQLMVQLISYLGLTELGLGTASTYLLYEPLCKNDKDKISDIVLTIKKGYKIISRGILIIGMLIFPIVYNFLINNTYSLIYIFFIWILYIMNTYISYNYSYSTILLIADQKNNIVKFYQGIIKNILLLLQIFVILKTKSFVLFLILEIISQLILWYLFTRKINKNYILNKIILKKVKIFKDMFYVLFHQISGLIVFNTDYIIISKFLSLNTVALYSNYIQIVNSLNILMTIIMNALIPSVGSYLVEKNEEEKWKLFLEVYTCFMYLSITISLITYIFIDKFISLWIGNDFILNKTIVYLIIINLFILIWRKGIDIFKNASGYYKDIYLPIMEAILNIVLSIYLVQKYGLSGVILGTVASNILIIVLIRPLITIKKIFVKKVGEYIRENIILGIYMLINIFLYKYILYFCKKNIDEINNFKILIVYMFFMSIVIILVNFVIFLSNKTFRKLIKKILIMIRR